MLAMRTEIVEAWPILKLEEHDATLLYRTAQYAFASAATAASLPWTYISK
jgi:hypothetical protein